MLVKFLDELTLGRDRGDNVGLRNGGVNLVLGWFSWGQIAILIKIPTI